MFAANVLVRIELEQFGPDEREVLFGQVSHDRWCHLPPAPLEVAVDSRAGRTPRVSM